MPVEKGQLIQPYIKNKESVKFSAIKRKNLQSILLQDLKRRRKNYSKINLPPKDLLLKIKDSQQQDYKAKQNVLKPKSSSLQSDESDIVVKDEFENPIEDTVSKITNITEDNELVAKEDSDVLYIGFTKQSAYNETTTKATTKNVAENGLTESQYNNATDTTVYEDDTTEMYNFETLAYEAEASTSIPCCLTKTYEVGRTNQDDGRNEFTTEGSM